MILDSKKYAYYFQPTTQVQVGKPRFHRGQACTYEGRGALEPLRHTEHR